jgi:ATP-dependent Clp protease adaptor protein ClpS
MTTPTVRPDVDEELLTPVLPPHKVIVMNRPNTHNRATAPSTPTPTITKPDLDEEALTRILPPFRVVVLDCQCHSFDDVEIALCKVIPGMSRSKAHQHAYEIHTTGASVVARAPKEKAEMYQERLAGFGLRVTIEPD